MDCWCDATKNEKNEKGEKIWYYWRQPKIQDIDLHRNRWCSCSLKFSCIQVKFSYIVLAGRESLKNAFTTLSSRQFWIILFYLEECDLCSSIEIRRQVWPPHSHSFLFIDERSDQCWAHGNQYKYDRMQNSIKDIVINKAPNEKRSQKTSIESTTYCRLPPTLRRISIEAMIAWILHLTRRLRHKISFCLSDET